MIHTPQQNYMMTTRLVLPKYGGWKGSKAENEDAPAEAGTSSSSVFEPF